MPTEIGPHDLTTNNSHPPFVVSASSDNFGSLPAFHAFDGTNTYWLGTNGGIDWLQIDLGAAQTLYSYSIKVNTIPEPARAPKNWTMQGSADGAAWNIVDTQTNQSAWTSGEIRTFVCAVATTPYRYFRLNITANNGDGTYTQVNEFSLFNNAVATNYVRVTGTRRQSLAAASPARLTATRRQALVTINSPTRMTRLSRTILAASSPARLTGARRQTLLSVAPAGNHNVSSFSAFSSATSRNLGGTF
jgi:hypothetical protein